MKFSEIVKQAVTLLQESQRITYRALKREFNLDDEALEDLKCELIDGQRLAADEDGKVLVWTGAAPVSSSEFQVSGSKGEGQKQETRNEKPAASSQLPSGERRQLTVLFCDMVGFTELANRVDPEVLEGIVRSYEDACAVCVTRYEGYVFQRLGDGIVAFFGYPLAHEGEAERAIHAGLAIIESLAKLDVPEVGHLHVRIGIATGVVVVAGAEKGAVGETPNLAARLQGIAQPGSIVVSERVRRLAGGVFDYTDLGEQTLKGIAHPTRAYRIAGVSHAASRFEAATQAGLTPLVGREHEIALLLERWQLAQDGEGQVVLLSGEPGIGKSRIVSALLERLEGQGVGTLRFQCSPYYSEARDAHARRRGHPFDLSWVLIMSGLLWDCRGEPAPLLARAEEAERLGRAHSLPFISEVLARVMKGIAWLRAGRLAEGIPQLRGALETFNAHGGELWMPYFRAVLAEGRALSGDSEGGLRLIEDSLTQTAWPGWEERWYLAEILRLKGWMLSLQGDLDGAEQHYLASLDWARQQQAKSWELRTSTSLARLWQSQGRTAEAHKMLSEVYNWFTEGFDTKDLQEAKAVLEELEP